MDVRVDSGGLGSMIRGGSGEMIQMAFSGQGHVIVQPSEGRHVTVASASGEGGAAKALGSLFS